MGKADERLIKSAGTILNLILKLIKYDNQKYWVALFPQAPLSLVFREKESACLTLINHAAIKLIMSSFDSFLSSTELNIDSYNDIKVFSGIYNIHYCTDARIYVVLQNGKS